MDDRHINHEKSTRDGVYRIEWRSGTTVVPLGSQLSRLRALIARYEASGMAGELVVLDENGATRIRQRFTGHADEEPSDTEETSDFDQRVAEHCSDGQG